MIDAWQIMEKLGISKKTNVANILKNKALCERILTERPIKMADFIRKTGIPRSVLKRLIDSGLVTSFTNANQFRPTYYIFENEFDTIVYEGEYDKTLMKYLKMACEFIFSIYRNRLSDKQVDIMRAYLIHFGNKKELDKVLQKYNLTLKEAEHIFHGEFMRVMFIYQFEEMVVKDLSIQKNELMKEVEGLKSLKHKLTRRVNKLVDDNNLKVFVNRQDTLNLELVDMDLSVRVFNGLKRLGCRTIQDIMDEGRHSFLGVRGLGIHSLKEIENLLAKYHLELPD